MCLMTAGLAWLFLRLAARFAPERAGAALLAWVLFSFGPPLLLYSAQIWIEVPAALLLAVALDRLASLSKLGQARPRDLVVFGLALALMPLLKIRLLLLVFPLLLLAGWRGRLGGKRTGAAGGRAGRWWCWRCSSTTACPSATPSRCTAAAISSCWPARRPTTCAAWSASSSTAPSGSSPARRPGCCCCRPFWRLFSSGGGSSPRWLLVAAPYTLAFAPRLEWYGGWAPPFRYPLVLLPLCGLLLIFALDRRQSVARAAWAGLGLATFLLTLVWLIQPGFTYNTADGLNHLLHLLGFRLDADLGRLLPSTVRPRLATWVWLAGALLAAAVLYRWLGGRQPSLLARRGAAAAGVLTLLLGVAGLVAAAETWPTTRAELEDGWVRKTGGTIDPDQWIQQRPAYRGGWRLQPGDAA